MKISKDDLFYIFDCADDPDQHVQGELDMNDIKNALIEDDLEIEGYEQVQWTKFDPNDTSTFPPKNGKRIIMAYEQSNNSNKWEVFVEPSTNYLIQFLRTDLPNINVYWRPLPNPPKED